MMPSQPMLQTGHGRWCSISSTSCRAHNLRQCKPNAVGAGGRAGGSCSASALPSGLSSPAISSAIHIPLQASRAKKSSTSGRLPCGGRRALRVLLSVNKRSQQPTARFPVLTGGRGDGARDHPSWATAAHLVFQNGSCTVKTDFGMAASGPGGPRAPVPHGLGHKGGMGRVCRTLTDLTRIRIRKGSLNRETMDGLQGRSCLLGCPAHVREFEEPSGTFMLASCSAIGWACFRCP